MTTAVYEGGELDLFRHATRWKAYWGSRVAAHVSGRVLEAGAGIGGTTRALLDRCAADEWICLEPDPALAGRIAAETAGCRRAPAVRVETGILADHLDRWRESFDSVLYIDVIEHIERDDEELERARQVLKSGGRLVVLVPAHPFLFSEFDRAVGHFRRYRRPTLLRAIPEGMRVESLRYLDAAGLAASLGNRLLLRQSMPREAQIRFWDRCLVPLSRGLDPLTFHRLGKSLLLVATKEGA